MKKAYASPVLQRIDGGDPRVGVVLREELARLRGINQTMSQSPPHECAKHKEMDTLVQMPDGTSRCSWCEVGELRLLLLKSEERNTQLELECAQLQIKLDARAP
jgi:hypothetical protein